MTLPKDFDEVIRKRLESLGKSPEKTKGDDAPKPKPSEKPVNSPERDPDSDEGVAKDKARKRAQKKKEKRMKGYVNTKGRKRG